MTRLRRARRSRADARPRHRWTPAEDAAVLSGRPLKEIASEIGRTYEAIKVRRYNQRRAREAA